MLKIEDAIYRDDAKAVQELLNSGEFKVNDFLSLERTALALAASCDFINVMKVLVDNGADVNLNNNDKLGYTPIESAAREGKLEAIKFLLKHNAEIDKGNTIKTNALIGACIGAHKEALELLLERGANINHVDDSGRTALHHLCQFAKQWGSWTITETVDGVTRELENPRFKQHTAIFQVLLEKGSDVNKLTDYGYTPLHHAAEAGAHEFIQPLIDKGADVNFLNAKGYSPLHAAADAWSFEAASILIRAGANVNAVDDDGFTPLLGAVAVKSPQLVKLLLENGAVKTEKAKINHGKVQIGDDAVMLAQRLNKPELIALLS